MERPCFLLGIDPGQKNLGHVFGAVTKVDRENKKFCFAIDASRSGTSFVCDTKTKSGGQTGSVDMSIGAKEFFAKLLPKNLASHTFSVMEKQPRIFNSVNPILEATLVASLYCLFGMVTHLIDPRTAKAPWSLGTGNHTGNKKAIVDFFSKNGLNNTILDKIDDHVCDALLMIHYTLCTNFMTTTTKSEMYTVEYRAMTFNEITDLLKVMEQ